MTAADLLALGRQPTAARDVPYLTRRAVRVWPGARVIQVLHLTGASMVLCRPGEPDLRLSSSHLEAQRALTVLIEAEKKRGKD